MPPPADAAPAAPGPGAPAPDDALPEPAVAVVAAGPALLAVAELLFPGCERHVLSRDELRPSVPFAGRLFAILGALPPGASVGLVVPVVVLTRASPSGPASSPGSPHSPSPLLPPSPGGAAVTGPGTGPAGPAGPLLAVADHVGLEARGPLGGRWPPGVPRTFPSMTGIYQPSVVRARGGARVYSTGVVVAGVTDAGRLTPFEARAAVAGGCYAVSDTLVPAAVIAACHGLELAACGVPQGSAND